MFSPQLADYDGDGNFDLVKTNFAGDTPTLYHNLGIDYNRTTLQDHSGRPQYLVEDHAQALRELV